MNADELLACLLILERRVPDRHVTVDEGMAVAWLDDFGRFDVHTGMAAAKAWPQDRFPSATEFVSWCQSMTRHDALESGNGELSSCRECDGSGWVLTDGTGHGTYRRCSLFAEESDRHGRKSQPELEVDPAGRARFLRMMREATAAAKAKGDHWHGGPDPCPVCGGIRPDLKRDPV